MASKADPNSVIPPRNEYHPPLLSGSNVEPQSPIARDIYAEITESLKDTHSDLISNLSRCSSFQPQGSDYFTDGGRNEVFAYYAPDFPQEPPPSGAQQSPNNRTLGSNESATSRMWDIIQQLRSPPKDDSEELAIRDKRKSIGPEYAESYASNISSFYNELNESNEDLLDDTKWPVADATLAQKTTTFVNPGEAPALPARSPLRDSQDASTSHHPTPNTGQGSNTGMDMHRVETKDTGVSSHAPKTNEDTVHDAHASNDTHHVPETPHPKPYIHMSRHPTPKPTPKRPPRPNYLLVPPPRAPTATPRQVALPHRPQLIGAGKDIQGRNIDGAAVMKEHVELQEQGRQAAQHFVKNMPSVLGDPNEARSYWAGSMVSGVRSEMSMVSPSMIRGPPAAMDKIVKRDDDNGDDVATADKERVREMIVRDFNKKCIDINSQIDRAKARIDRNDKWSEAEKEAERVHVEKVRIKRILMAKKESGYKDVDNDEAIYQAIRLPRTISSSDGNTTHPSALADSNSNQTQKHSAENNKQLNPPTTEQPPHQIPSKGSASHSIHGGVGRWLVGTGWKLAKICLAIPTDPALKSTSISQRALSSSAHGAARQKYKAPRQIFHIPGELRVAVTPPPILPEQENEVRPPNDGRDEARSFGSTQWPTDSVMYEPTQVNTEPGDHIGWTHISEPDQTRPSNDVHEAQRTTDHCREKQHAADRSNNLQHSQASSISSGGYSSSNTQWPHLSELYERSSMEASSRAASITRQFNERKDKERKDVAKKQFSKGVMGQQMHLSG